VVRTPTIVIILISGSRFARLHAREAPQAALATVDGGDGGQANSQPNLLVHPWRRRRQPHVGLA
jgi:hypothetical protein